MEPRSRPKNRQMLLARAFGGSALCFALLAMLSFMESNPLTGAWALAFLGIFLSVGSVVVACIFRSRARKMESLLSSERLLATWELDDGMLQAYVALLRAESTGKSRALMWVVGVLFAMVTLVFLFLLEEKDMAGFALIMGSILLLVFGASRFFPWFYAQRNLKGDRQVLIGGRYLYINGYFHDWAYPLSGLSKVALLKKPFWGLHVVYYYTDRTLRHTHALKIPAPADLDLRKLLEDIRAANRADAPSDAVEMDSAPD
ncbi:MAG: hypothetical protein Q8O00_00290 [Holophaga sp.]|nr:hypothetical protein [Holophaga sp.]